MQTDTDIDIDALADAEDLRDQLREVLAALWEYVAATADPAELRRLLTALGSF
jgi:hypothetical protein